MIIPVASAFAAALVVLLAGVLLRWFSPRGSDVESMAFVIIVMSGMAAVGIGAILVAFSMEVALTRLFASN